MKKVIIFIDLIILSVTVFSQVRINYEQFELSDYWNIKPILYNNHYNESNRDNDVSRWQNYWYYREKNTTELIPDSLTILFFTSLSLFHIENLDSCIKNTDYTIKSVIQYKYGDTDYSYNIKNPKLSEPIVLMEKKMPLGIITKDMMSGLRNSSFDIFVDVPIKKHLKDLDIYILDALPPEGDYYALNQIIITSYFINDQGEVKNFFEFTFPINGAYKDRKHFGKIRY
jgi:hypothetical protein